MNPVPDPSSISAQSTPPQPGEHPFSCSTNLSKEVNDNLRRMHLSGRAYDVCLYAHNLTFGNAGWHRQQGKSELACTFDLASWAEALLMNRSNLQRIIARLVQHQVIFFTPLVLPGRATFTWNVNFPEWQAGYDPHRTSLQAKNLGLHAQKKPSKLSTVEPSELSLPATDSAPSELSMVDIATPSELSTPAINATIRTKDDSFEGAAGVAALASNKSTEEEFTEETEANASLAPGARVVQEVLIHSNQTDPKMRAIPKRKPASPPSHSQSGIIAPARARLHEASTKENRAPNPLIDEQRRLVGELQQKYNEANGRLMVPSQGDDKRRLHDLSDEAKEALEKARDRLYALEAGGEQEEPESAPEPDEADQLVPQAALVVTPEGTLVALPDPETWRRQLFSRLCEVFSISLIQISKQTRDMLNAVVKQLKDTGILPDQVPALKQVYHRTFRDATCTPPALAKQAYLLKPFLA